MSLTSTTRMQAAIDKAGKPCRLCISIGPLLLEVLCWCPYQSYRECQPLYCSGALPLTAPIEQGSVYRGQQEEGIVGQNRPAQHRQAHEGAVTAVVPTPDGLYLLTAGTDSRIRLWNLHDNR